MVGGGFEEHRFGEPMGSEGGCRCPSTVCGGPSPSQLTLQRPAHNMGLNEDCREGTGTERRGAVVRGRGEGLPRRRGLTRACVHQDPGRLHNRASDGKLAHKLP